MKTVIGLGNPGKAYANTRHNVGIRCIDAISHDLGIPLSQRRVSVVLGQGQFGQDDIILVKPRTFMNNSGNALSYLIDRFHTPPEDLIVVYDDMSLPLGTIRLRPSGSSGGHRGIDSIIDSIGGSMFPRVRIGIGRPPFGQGDIGFVLGTFTAEEAPLVQEAVVLARDAAKGIIVNGIDWAMNNYN